MTFPHSRQVMARHLKGLADAQDRRYTWDNSLDLFKLNRMEDDCLNRVVDS